MILTLCWLRRVLILVRVDSSWAKARFSASIPIIHAFLKELNILRVCCQYNTLITGAPALLTLLSLWLVLEVPSTQEDIPTCPCIPAEIILLCGNRSYAIMTCRFWPEAFRSQLRAQATVPVQCYEGISPCFPFKCGPNTSKSNSRLPFILLRVQL